jgi:DNA modification methylase
MSATTQAYRSFLEAKVAAATVSGIVDLDEAAINPVLKPHQRAVVKWMVEGGRRACFAAFGLGKSVIQLEAVRLTLERAGGRGLIVCPLGVRQEFRRDAVELLGWSEAPRFIRSIEEAAETGVHLTNYETVREGKLDPRHFTVASLDEASILRGFGGTKTFREFMRLFAGQAGPRAEMVGGVPYRFVATATPAPNEFEELLAYAAYLDIMDVAAAKTRFFKRDSTKADNLTLHAHKRQEFWNWLGTWALFVQRPSDICGCQCHRDSTSGGSGSAGSSSGAGNQGSSAMALGSADATAAESTSPAQPTSSRAASSAADACDPSTVEMEPEPIPSGAEYSNAAPTRDTRTGQTTEVAASPSVIAGESIPTSSPTWDSHQSGPRSSGSTTPEGTSQPTADGQHGKPKLGTPGDPSSSPSAAGHSPSRPGRRSSAPTTGRSTVATSSGGHPRGSSPTYCDSCRCDEGYALPPLDVRWHEIPTDHSNAGQERDGQSRMFRDSALGVTAAAREKRDSLQARVLKARELVEESPEDHFLLWHDLESERHAITAMIPGAVAIWGSQDLEEREQLVADFSDGKIARFATKPILSGSGCNFQRHCHRAIFVGIGFKANDLIQACHRIQRFLQPHPVRIDLIYTEAEREVRRALERKWAQHTEMVATMAGLIREHGLAHASLAGGLKRSMSVDRVEASGEGYRLINGDACEETRAIASDSIHLVVTSIPFSTQYEYTPSYRDLGHTDNDEHFFEHLGFLTPELLRVLQPGRVAAVHVKDRIVPGGLTGLGFQTVSPFSDYTIAHFRKHGFAFLGRKTVVTDVVRENNQTYRLGWTEQCKDGSRMGAGLPEYVLLFRKPPSDSSNGYADVPVVKVKREWIRGAIEHVEGCSGGSACECPEKPGRWNTDSGYSRSRWQIDAHGFMRSNGNRPLTVDDISGLPHEAIFKLFRKYSLTQPYDFEQHVALGEALERKGLLPVTFMLLQPASWHPDVWTDVARMRTLNMLQERKGQEQHLCPLPFDIVDRLITQFSQPGETVYDPFGGLFTVPYCAIRLRRRGLAVELSPRYFADGAAYCAAAAREASMPSLFDLIAEEGESA